jgi:membrane protein DedA with SNARE-associated domain
VGNVRRPLVRLATAVPIPALLHIHIHLHHRFHGPPFDYAGLAAAAAASWLGLPGPGEPVLIAAGVLAARHKLDIGSVVLVAFLAAAGGGLVGYLVGRLAGRAVVTARGPFRRARLWAVERGDEVFERYTIIAILIAPSWVAGINRVGATTYNTVNLVSAAAWAAGLGFGAYFLGPPVIDLVGDAGTAVEIILAILVVGAAVTALRRRRFRRRQGRVDTRARSGSS